jgi:hypothetical protein
MTDVSVLVNDATLLFHLALRRAIKVDDDIRAAILDAQSDPAALANATRRDAFYDAYQKLAALLKVTPAEIASLEERTARLQTLVSDAQSLLSYAASNAKELDDDIRDALIETADALTAGTLDVKGEARFYKAYQELTKALAPVTADTLLASETRMPRLNELTGGPRTILRRLSRTTAGRFVHFAAFVFVLLLTGFALGHYASGTTEIDRYAKAMQDLQKSSATRVKKSSRSGSPNSNSPT